MDLRTALGSTLRDIRHEEGKTLRDVSSKAYVSIAHLSDVERGTKDASYEFLEIIARNYNIPIHELLQRVAARLERNN